TPSTHRIRAFMRFTPVKSVVHARQTARAAVQTAHSGVVSGPELCQSHSPPEMYSPALPAAFLPFLLLGWNQERGPRGRAPISPSDRASAALTADALTYYYRRLC